MGDILNLDPLELLGITIRTAVVYACLMAALRIAGKRELGQLRLFDLVVVLIIANAVQNAMVGPDTSLNGGLLAAFVLIAMNWVVGQLSDRVPWLDTALTGTPTVLVRNGKTFDSSLRRERVSTDELLMALREHGYESPRQVKLAILEVDGTISVVARDAPILHSGRRVRGRKQRI